MSAVHPALSVPFDELLDRLKAEFHAGNVRVVQDGPLWLWAYQEDCARERRWNQWNTLARGLILDMEKRRVVATPFPKFFNYGEREGALPDEPFEVTEKLDGSLGIIFYHGGRWRVATKGSFASDQAKWAEAWLLTHWPGTRQLNCDVTYLAEIIYPENRIVIDYGDFSGLVLIGAYRRETGELSRAELETEAYWLSMKVVETHAGKSLDDLLALAKTIPHTSEGFVVRFASGLRIKIKGDEYLRVHKIMSNCTPLGIWELMVAGDNLDAIRKELPEEFHADFNAIWSIFRTKSFEFRERVKSLVAEYSCFSDKELGLLLARRKGHPCERFVFPARKSGFLENTLIHGHPDRRKMFNEFRPHANWLEGYTPSSAANRFTEAS